MKNNLRIFLVSIVALAIFSSCKKNNFAVDRDALAPQTAAEFVLSTNVVNYPVTAAVGAPPLSIPVALTNVESGDRVIPVTYTSPTGAIFGTDYTGPTSVTIKGGKLLDSLRVSGVFAQYSGGKKDSVKIKLGGGGITGLFGKDSVWVVLQKYCDVVLTDLAGDYPNTTEYKLVSGAYSATYGFYAVPSQPYVTPVSVGNLVQTSATTATGTFTNLYDNGWQDVTFTMDWTDASNFKISIPYQDTGDATPTWIRTSTTKPSTFSACDRTFTLVVDLVDPATGLPQTGLSNYKFVLQ